MPGRLSKGQHELVNRAHLGSGRACTDCAAPRKPLCIFIFCWQHLPFNAAPEIDAGAGSVADKELAREQVVLLLSTTCNHTTVLNLHRIRFLM
jgi:hypothetical protein